ncbi:MAG TPA: response regulator transcription factor [Dongiaceae bacterium]|nr:response regulator transcription factor [Dongiaceae bacterium]
MIALRHRIEPTPGQSRDIVLVVDDSPETLSFLTEAIEGSGSTVLVAVDGESALSLTDRVTPDLILLDAVMPGIGGFETCRRLKRIRHLAHIPVIFMTGLSDTEHIVKGLEAGGVDYLTKPIVVDELMARMRVHLANARGSEAARSALDAAGRFLLAVSGDGDVRWTTPQAAKLLQSLSDDADDSDFHLPAEVVRWLAKAAKGEVEPHVWTQGDARLEFTHLGRLRSDEHLLRLAKAAAKDDAELLRQHFTLTSREAEVLLWIARGKSNKDISSVLGISPRTVNKHLEQVFQKLGVENRASAAAMTVQALHHLGSR